MDMLKKIIIASRESPLAMWQAEFIKKLISEVQPAIEITIKGFKTQGDILLNESLAAIGGKGLFIKELEHALLERKADLAVHSMKDLPMDIPEEFKLIAISKREDARDAFVSNEYGSLKDMPKGAIVGTSSLRRQSQIKSKYPHLVIEPLRGNLQTRLKRSWPIGRALKGLLDKILTDPRWDLKFIGMQVVIEGLALAAFNAAKQATSDPVYKQMLEYIIRDEARHVTFGINYLTDYVQTLSEEDQIDRAKFALEACTVSRNRLKAYDVWEKYGMDIEYTEAYQKEHIFQTQFQDVLFSRIMPNLKRIGLLTDLSLIHI